MAFANGDSHIRGAAELRHKETDRIMAITKLLDAIGSSMSNMTMDLVSKVIPIWTLTARNLKVFMIIVLLWHRL